MTDQRPAWCRCADDYRRIGKTDPNCPHEEFTAVEALLDALDAELDYEVSEAAFRVRLAYDAVAAFIRPEEANPHQPTEGEDPCSD